MKKLLLSLGAVAAVVAPVASVIACGSDDDKDTNTNPGTTDSTNTDGGTDGGSTDGGSTTGTANKIVAPKAISRHFETAADFNANSLATLSDVTEDYARNQFLFGGGTDVLDALIKTVKSGHPTLKMLDENNESVLDGIADSIRGFLNQSDDQDFASLKATEASQTGDQSCITVGLFKSKSTGATEDDSVLIGINGVSLDVAKKLIKAAQLDTASKEAALRTAAIAQIKTSGAQKTQDIANATKELETMLGAFKLMADSI